MDGPGMRQISYLMPAGRSGRDQSIALFHTPNCGKELSFRNRFGNVVVIAGVAEGTGHPAATRVEIYNSRAGDFAHQREC